MAMAAKLVNLQFFSSNCSNSNLRFPNNKLSLTSFKTMQILCVKRSARTRKQRYPSEKKKLRRASIIPDKVEKKDEGIWRFYKLGVPADQDPGKDHLGISDGLLEAIAKVIEFPIASGLPSEAFTVVRKSFDARKLLKEPKFVYTVDMDVKKLLDLEPRMWDFVSELKPKVGLVEHMLHETDSVDLIRIIHESKRSHEHVGFQEVHSEGLSKLPTKTKPKVAVVGGGPSGLFASLVLAEFGADVTLIERGQAVEQRGRDIGALVVRRILQLESNFCFGEGGAGTWSDGKLVTRIGRNSDSVLAVMKTLVRFGAPANILVDGKPHLGTDRLIPLLRNFRQHLQQLGVTIKFGTRVDDLLVEDAHVVGVRVSDVHNDLHSDNQKLGCDAVVLAVGHSARDTYEMLLSNNVDMVPKDFSVGLRIEHPQELINSIQYSALASEVCRGRGKVPVADYKVVKYVDEAHMETTPGSRERSRSCYSFCMCPGGQVVLTSTNPSELCINGMSFSRRASRWANAALVVTVTSKDFDAMQFHGPLAGVEFQREFERKAATLGGGNFVVPVQTVPDFLNNKLSGKLYRIRCLFFITSNSKTSTHQQTASPETSLPTSSYRLGVKAANLHELFPAPVTEALQHAISMFDKELPGFISKDALLHGVETRTSSPVQILRDGETYESASLKGLYPIGEGAGYAGGIVSAAVDGLYAGFAVAKKLGLFQDDIESLLGKSKKNTGFLKY